MKTFDLQKFIVTVSCEVEYTTAFEVVAISMEQAEKLAKHHVAVLPTDKKNWEATTHCTDVKVFRKINAHLSSKE